MSIIWDNRINLSKIGMIKEIRSRGDIGLKEAKDAIEEVGLELPSYASDDEIISATLSHIDPHRFPSPAEMLDYKTMWMLLHNARLDPITEALVNQIEDEARESVERTQLATRVRKLLKKSLDSVFASIQGNGACSAIYSSTSTRSLDAKVSKEELKEILIDEFIDWVRAF